MKRTSKHVYREDFETGELRAWASYPPCQDTAYDPFTYPGKIRPGDDRTCLVAVKYPPWNETQLLGAFKLLDLVLDHDSHIGFRYYIKRHNGRRAYDRLCSQHGRQNNHVPRVLV